MLQPYTELLLKEGFTLQSSFNNFFLKDPTNRKKKSSTPNTLLFTLSLQEGYLSVLLVEHQHAVYARLVWHTTDEIQAMKMKPIQPKNLLGVLRRLLT